MNQTHNPRPRQMLRCPVPIFSRTSVSVGSPTAPTKGALRGGGVAFEIVILSGQLVKPSPRVLHFMLLPAGLGETVPKIS